MRTNISFPNKTPPRNSKLVSTYGLPSNLMNHAMQEVGGKVHRLVWKLSRNNITTPLVKTSLLFVDKKQAKTMSIWLVASTAIVAMNVRS